VAAFLQWVGRAPGFDHTPRVLRILTLNVWHGRQWRSQWRLQRLEPLGQRRRRRNALVAGLAELRPDLLCLQECLPAERWPRALARDLGYELVVQIANGGVRVGPLAIPAGLDGGEGIAILARPGLGLRQLGAKKLSGWGWPGARWSFQTARLSWALAAEVTVAGRRLTVVTTHLRYTFQDTAELGSLWTEVRSRVGRNGPLPARILAAAEREIGARDQEVRALAGWCRELSRGSDLVCAGDLNLDPDAPQVAALARSADLVRLGPSVGLTWDPAGNPHVAASASENHRDGTPKELWSRLTALHDGCPQTPDHVLVSAGSNWPVARIERVFDSPYQGIFASDHYGLLAELG
jgi:endonuclease/exonuclease/phosphatase family metal-dependent hydrolase